MNAHVLIDQASTASPWAAKTPTEGFMYLTSAIGGHLLTMEALERTFFGMILEMIRPEERKKIVLAFLEHEKELKEGVRELLFHKDRLAALLGVELHQSPFEREL